MLCENGKLLAFTMQKGTLWSDEPFSPQIGLEFFYNQELYDNVNKLMQSLNWNGVANIDIRFDNSTKKYLVLEINPRFWETTEASEIAGVNFPYLYCLASLNKWSPPNYKHVKFLNLLGLSKTVKSNKLFLLKLKFILKNTSIKYYIKDPKPLLLITFNKIKNAIS